LIRNPDKLHHEFALSKTIARERLLNAIGVAAA
jgi:hypothetical protein